MPDIVFRAELCFGPNLALDEAKQMNMRDVQRADRRGYWWGLGLVALATLLGQLVHRFFDPTNIMALYLLGVVITAVAWGFGPSVMVATLSVLALDFFFVPPYLTFVVADTQYVFTFIAMLGVGLTISYLTSRIRQQTQAARRRESETTTLYALSRDIKVATGLEDTLHTIIENAKETFQHDIVTFLPDPERNGKLRPHVGSAGLAIEDKDLAAAQWSFEHQKTVGSGTDTLPDASGIFIPLNASRGPVGVLALWIADSAAPLAAGQTRLLEAYADLAAVAIEHIELAEEARNAQILAASDQLQTALLNSISHDLRTPLVSVIGVLSSLQEEEMGLDEAARKNLIQVAREEAERLNRLITNLLDSSRIEAGAIRISRQLVEVGDIVGVALGQLSGRSGSRLIKKNVPSNLPFVSVDFGLIVQVLVNVLDNAFKYSPPDSPIDIGVQQVDDEVEIVVADRGVGIPPEDLAQVFNKFYRVHRPDSVSGTGLGLSICRGIVEAHEGRIVAENRPCGGTIIRITLPIEEPVTRERGKAK
ncbi:MAG: DUF4118 domain-containing protein [Chloroflexi bacterium]|nr:DUF4118 domain-containing protein [Chloroflexota bacterium]